MQSKVVAVVVCLAFASIPSLAMGQQLRPGDAAGLTLLADALDRPETAQLEPRQLVLLVVAGLSELDLDRSTACRQALAPLERTHAAGGVR